MDETWIAGIIVQQSVVGVSLSFDWLSLSLSLSLSPSPARARERACEEDSIESGTEESVR